MRPYGREDCTSAYVFSPYNPREVVIRLFSRTDYPICSLGNLRYRSAEIVSDLQGEFQLDPYNAE